MTESICQKVNIYDSLAKYESNLSPAEDELHFVAEIAPTEIIQALGNKTENFTIDCGLGNIVTVTIGAAVTISLTPKASATECRCLTIIMSNGGAYTIAWPTTIKWPYGIAPVLTASGKDIITLLTVDNGVTWYGVLNAQEFAS